MPARRWWLLSVILAGTVLAYLPAIRAPFEFDDVSSIPGNATIRAPSPLSAALTPPPNTSVSGRPVVNLTLALNHRLNALLGVDQRPDPFGPYKTVGYHVVNLALHLACGLLLFLLVLRTSALARGDADEALALAVTAVWLLHPLQTEAVNYLVQRTEVIVSLCYLATLYAATRSWSADTKRERLGWQGASVVACLVGAGSKEVIITAPVMVLLYDRAFHARSWRALAPRRWFYASLMAVAALVAVSAWTSDARSGTVGFGLGMPWYRYFYSQMWAVAHYLKLAIWPAGLALDYGYQPVTGTRGLPGALVLSVLGVLTLVAWRRAERWGWLAFLGSWVFVILAPSSSVVPITTEIAAERRMYLALAGVVTAVMAGALGLARLRNLSRVAGAAFVVAAVALATLTYRRSWLYASPELLWEDAVRAAPGNARALDNLAATLFHSDPPRQAEAKLLYEKAIALDSTYVHAWPGLAAIAINEGRGDDAEALLHRVLAIEPGYSDAVFMLGRLYLRTRRPDRALPHLVQYASAYPGEDSYLALGMAQMQTGNLREAARVFQEVIDRNPDRPDALHYLGGVLVELGDGARAIPLLERAASGPRGSATDVGLLAVAYAQTGRADDAHRAADAATQLAPRDPPVLVLAGRAMLTANRPADAARYLSEALRLDPASTEAQTYLARARATSR